MQLGNGFTIGRAGLYVQRASLSGLQNAWRNKLLTLATILIMALMFFVFNLILALSLATDSVLSSVAKKVDISVEVLPGVENYTIQTMVADIKAMPEVSEVLYLPKDQALSQFGARYPNVIQFLSQHQIENPLPDVLRIVSHTLEGNAAILTYLEGPRFSRLLNQEKLAADTAQKSRNEKILDITLFLKRTGLWLIVIFGVVTVLILFNSINLNIHAHRDEIAIMQLVGAKRHFIRAGFLIEGVLMALAAFLLSLVISRLTLVYLTTNLLNVISNENLLVGLNAILIHFQDQFAVTFLWQGLMAAVLGFLSSYLAIELYLRRRLNQD